MSLAEALALVEKRRPELALAKVVAVWAQTRDGDVGVLLRAIGDAAAVSLPSWNSWVLATMEAGPARLQAAMTMLRATNDAEQQNALLQLMGETGADARLGGAALRLLLNHAAAITTRETAAAHFAPSADGALLAEYLEKRRELPHSVVERVGPFAPVTSISADERARLPALRASLEAADLGGLYARALLKARDGVYTRKVKAAARREAEHHARRRAWNPPALTESPRLAATHLLSSPPRDTTASRAPPGGTELAPLLSEWRRTTSAALAAQLEALDAVEHARLKKMARGRVDALWHELAGDLRASGWLAANIFTDIPTHEAGESALLKRFDLLDRLLPDPRAGAALTQLALRPLIRGVFPERVFERLVSSIRRAGDPRQAAPLSDALLAPPWKRQSDHSFFSKALPAAIAALDPGETSPIRTSRRALGPDVSAQLDELVSGVLKAPNDDAARLVLGDRMTELGDPRGEFIALQIRAARESLSATLAERMALLEARHTTDWLGPAARVLSERRWERGFLVSAHLQPSDAASAATWRLAYAHPSLELLQRLEQGRGSVRHFVGFLRGGRMCSLDRACIPERALRMLDVDEEG